MEPVLGAGGVIPPHPSFLPAVREICSRHGILLLLDEVITAFGRLGSWSGARHFGVKPDMIATAKAITNGYFPFGAVMINDMVAEAFESDTSGAANIGSGYTYSGHPVGAAAAVACLKETVRLNVKDNAAARGTQMFEGFKALKEKYDIIGDIRGGVGLMTAMELIGDKSKKAPLDKARIEKMYEATYAAGTMVRVSGPNVIISPSLIIEEADVTKILADLDHGLSQA